MHKMAYNKNILKSRDGDSLSICAHSEPGNGVSPAGVRDKGITPEPHAERREGK